MNTDFLLIILKSLMQKRSDLKVVLMSATLNADLFSRYFAAEGCALISIPGRAYPVSTYCLEDALAFSRTSVTSSSPVAYKFDPKSASARASGADLGSARDAAERERRVRLQKLSRLAGKVPPEVLQSLSIVDETLLNKDLIAALVVSLCSGRVPPTSSSSSSASVLSGNASKSMTTSSSHSIDRTASTTGNRVKGGRGGKGSGRGGMHADSEGEPPSTGSEGAPLTVPGSVSPPSDTGGAILIFVDGFAAIRDTIDTLKKTAALSNPDKVRIVIRVNRNKPSHKIRRQFVYYLLYSYTQSLHTVHLLYIICACGLKYDCATLRNFPCFHCACILSRTHSIK